MSFCYLCCQVVVMQPLILQYIIAETAMLVEYKCGELLSPAEVAPPVSWKGGGT